MRQYVVTLHESKGNTAAFSDLSGEVIVSNGSVCEKESKPIRNSKGFSRVVHAL
jgi:hypothetical protein